MAVCGARQAFEIEIKTPPDSRRRASGELSCRRAVVSMHAGNAKTAAGRHHAAAQQGRRTQKGGTRAPGAPSGNEVSLSRFLCLGKTGKCVPGDSCAGVRAYCNLFLVRYEILWLQDQDTPSSCVT